MLPSQARSLGAVLRLISEAIPVPGFEQVFHFAHAFLEWMEVLLCHIGIAVLTLLVCHT